MNAKRRVAVFRSELLPPSETFIRDQVSALTVWEPVLLGRKEVEGGLPTPNISREIVPESGSRIARTLRFWLSRPDPLLVSKLQQLQVDLVHVHFGTDAADIWPSVKATGLPMVVTLHGYDINIDRDWWEAGHGGLRRRVYPSRLLQMAHHPAVSFVAVSLAIKHQAVNVGIPEEKITVAYIGVDTDRFTPGGMPLDQRRKRILFVGRMVEKKAPLLLIRAFTEILQQIPDSELVMIGDGPLLGSAKLLATALNVPVTFLGALGSDAVLAQLHEARIFCLPSITASNGDAEGLPISILEALACGVPAVTSARGGLGEAVIHGVNGIGVKENNASDLAKSLKSILTGEIDISKFSIAARNIATLNFSNSNTTRSLESSIYRGIVQDQALTHTRP